MARVTYGTIVTSINGKVGGNIFQNNKHGFTLRAIWPKIKDSSPYSQRIKANFKSALYFWQNMSNESRAAWDSFASSHPWPTKNNTSSILSGYNAFMAINQLRQAANYNISDGLVSDSWSIPSITATVETNGSILRLVFNYDLLTYKTGVVVKLSAPIRNSQNSPYNNLRVMVPNSSSGTIQIVTTQYLARYGALPTVGDKLFVELTFFNLFAPQKSNPLAYTIYVTAFSS